MARQVAHDIKNPLTPIQLIAEHLRRVHADRGEPLAPVLEDCVDTILTQVRLLRQIASEFSSFASSPTARPAPRRLHELLARGRRSRTGRRLDGRVRIDVDVAGGPAAGASSTARCCRARADQHRRERAARDAGRRHADGRARGPSGRRCCVRVADTGVGMDAEALARAFEPYFSTKATGTGLGLPIAKRNVELNGGTIAVASERDAARR